ncbi:MAG: MMPL family transporter [Candidatus Saccharimonadales bacterium]
MKHNPRTPRNRFNLTNKWLRVALPAMIVIAWVAIGGIGGPTFGKLSSVSTNDQAAFLPSSAQSTRVQELQKNFRDSKSIPAIVVIESDNTIPQSDYPSYLSLAEKIGNIKGVQTPTDEQPSVIAGPIPSEDGKAIQLIVPIADTDNSKEVVAKIRETANDGLPSGQTAYVTGPAGLAADLVKAFGGIDGILLLVALSVVFVILLLVYKSIALPFIVLLNSVFALCGSILLVYAMAKWGWILLNGQSQGILSILVIGAATDYSLLLVARYSEALSHIESKWAAIWQGIKASFEPIVASAATVILALLCLLFSDLNSNRSLGPIAASGIALSLIATLTFLPALLVLFGRNSFWPRIPKHQPETALAAADNNQDITTLWRKIGEVIARRPRMIWALSLALLVMGSVGLLQLRASGVPQTDLILAQSEAVDGQAVIAKHYDSGIATPMVVIADATKADAVTEKLQDIPGVADVSTYSGASARPGGPVQPAKVVDGKVLINATLTASQPDAAEAKTVVTEARRLLPVIDQTVLVGGTSAVSLDTNITATNDLKKIIPIVLLVILIILIILLRSVIAPLILIVSVVISYAAAIGISAFVFNDILGFPGADASVPLFGFIFLVALGVDYNIFLMTRVREESLSIGTRQGIIRGLGKTGGVITSAGLVLAATFAALGIIPILFLAQLAFIVAFGVLLDTIIVRSLLVPAFSYDVGKAIWWPSKLWRDGKE